MTMLVSLSEARSLGLKRYFTGVPCIHGHIAERQVTNGRCVICSKATSKGCRARNPEKSRAFTKRYKKAHPEWVKERAKARYDRDPQKVQAQNKKWLGKNPGVRTKYMRGWRSENPEIVRAIKHRRRARLTGSDANYCASDVREIRKLQRNKCAICAMKLIAYHIDHIVPLARGGSNGRKNIQILCPQCNLRKSFHDPIVFMQLRGRLL